MYARKLSSPLGLLEAGAQCAPYNCTFQLGSKLFSGRIAKPEVISLGSVFALSFFVIENLRRDL